MASAVIHLAVSSEINKVIKHNNDKILIGSIAPDISKLIGESKVHSHFLDGDNNIPNMERFLLKYKGELYDDFVLGYFIHLYTDFLWFKYFISEVYENDMVTKLDGTRIKCVDNMLSIYIYNDYTNLNAKLIDEYNLDLSVFYRELPKLENIIDEIPMEKIKIIVDKSLTIIENSKEHKEFIFNIENIKSFIATCVDLILAKLKELNVI